MPDIGATLRETRMRRRIDISEVEAETKIRARYLRALENEEWDLLPGPTFVKTFLRTYAEYLEIDSRALVEEYKQRFEHPAAHELTPFAPNLGGARDRRRSSRPRRGISPVLVVGAVFVALLAVLVVLGLTSPDDEQAVTPSDTATTPTRTTEPRTTTTRRKRRSSSSSRRKRRTATPARLSVRLAADQPVNVCMVNADGRKVVDDVTLDPASPAQVYRSRSFRLWTGNGAMRVRVGNRTIDVPDRTRPAGYRVTRTALRPIEDDNPCL